MNHFNHHVHLSHKFSKCWGSWLLSPITSCPGLPPPKPSGRAPVKSPCDCCIRPRLRSIVAVRTKGRHWPVRERKSVPVPEGTRRCTVLPLGPPATPLPVTATRHKAPSPVPYRDPILVLIQVDHFVLSCCVVCIVLSVMKPLLSNNKVLCG